MTAMDFVLGVAAVPAWIGWVQLGFASIGLGVLLKADA